MSAGKESSSRAHHVRCTLDLQDKHICPLQLMRVNQVELERTIHVPLAQRHFAACLLVHPHAHAYPLRPARRDASTRWERVVHGFACTSAFSLITASRLTDRAALHGFFPAPANLHPPRVPNLDLAGLLLSVSHLPKINVDSGPGLRCLTRFNAGRPLSRLKHVPVIRTGHEPHVETRSPDPLQRPQPVNPVLQHLESRRVICSPYRQVEGCRDGPVVGPHDGVRGVLRAPHLGVGGELRCIASRQTGSRGRLCGSRRLRQ